MIFRTNTKFPISCFCPVLIFSVYLFYLFLCCFISFSQYNSTLSQRMISLAEWQHFVHRGSDYEQNWFGKFIINTNMGLYGFSNIMISWSGNWSSIIGWLMCRKALFSKSKNTYSETPCRLLHPVNSSVWLESLCLETKEQWNR